MKNLISVLMFVSLAACGGDDDGGGGLDCGFAECGGDPVGTWTISDSCVDGEPDPSAECPDATVTIVSFALSGTVTINADMTQTSSITTMVETAQSIPLSCIAPATCADIADVVEGATCTANGDACDCTVVTNQDSSDTGSWSVAGNQITITDDGEDPEVNDFCVDGNTMQTRATDGGLTVGLLLTR